MKWVVLLAAAVLLSGCGISSTGVVQSGDPASGVPPFALLYFVRDDRLVPVPRPIGDPVDVSTALELLLNGPDATDRRHGLTTALTHVPAPWTSTDGAEVSLRLPPGTGPLPPIAARQLICTVAEARLVDDPEAVTTGVSVVLTGPDGRHVRGSSGGCPR
ncbi:hypothetical protein [Streptomyces gilvus]|uniref:hypothetical protein n=1 Tax=Streptomyces gilvus TaxID=2920937 RepID=UPI001F10DE45|nr:hypothetical protein [Streptomyces sp. CME 23]MCH5676781.1 hypothetical protein [Streptomyces sp. CME 23]